MGVIKQFRTIKIHPSGWPFIAGMVTVSFFIDSMLGGLFVFFVCASLFTFYLFRVQKPTISPEKNVILAPLSGKITEVTEIISPHKMFFLDEPVKKIVIRCGFFSSASIHAPTSIKILQKQKIQEASGRLLLIRALILDTEEKYELDELIMIFSSSAPYLFPECNIEIEDTLSKGQNFGFLTFGGKLDLLVPNNFLPLRIQNQTSISGETILAMCR